MKNKNNAFLDLIENNNDSYEDLKTKNKKLREIIIKISEEIKSLKIKYNTMQKDYTTEKKMLLEKLDKITNNYKMYAEGYQEKSILKKDINTLINNYKQNNKVLNSFKDSFSFLLKKNITMYNECKKLDNEMDNINDINNKYLDFIFDIKNKLLNQILKFKKNIDMINFPDFYKDYFTFVNCEEKENNNKNKYLEKNKYKINPNIEKQSNNSKNKLIKSKWEKKNNGKLGHKYSFTKLDLISNNNSNYYIGKKNNNKDERNKYKSNQSYNETNFYKTYLNNHDNCLSNNPNSPTTINYLQYGNCQYNNNKFKI